MSDIFNKINEWSYQRFDRFFGIVKPSDIEFDNKMKKIYDLIINEKVEDLDFITKDSGCSFDECVLKIRYLKNKRLIGDYYIDIPNKIIKECSSEDEILLQKYVPYIYNKHLQINEIALRLPNTSINNLDVMQERVYKDIKYLNDKGLLNGISFDEVDKKIVYYTIEKHKNEADTITINCPNCGAINDVNRHGKVRCAYCKSIIEDK
jgi:hypothetical protein